MSGIGGYDGASSSREASMQEYLDFRASVAGQYDETVQTCELCGFRLGGVDLIIHVHIDHRLTQSDICPCAQCYLDKMARISPANPQTPPRSGVMPTSGVNAHLQPPTTPHATGLRSSPQVSQMPTPPPSENPPRQIRATGIAYSELQAVATSPSARPQTYRTRRTMTPAAETIPVPNDIIFFSGDGDIRENNLPYEMSLIESGSLHKDAAGQVTWTTNTHKPPPWLDDNNKPVLSPLTKNPMRLLPFLPDNIPTKPAGWQLAHWFRQGAAQGVQVKWSDIMDRMSELETQSALTSRLSTLQRNIGMLPQSNRSSHNWPTKQAMDAVSKLTYLQLKFNTWWDVLYEPISKAWIARPPVQHDAYRDPASVTPGTTATQDMPWYMIQNPEERQISEEVKLLDDAKLFLEIKGAECDVPLSFNEIMEWFSKPCDDRETQRLELDILLEFKRWRQGCPDSLSIDCLRAALDRAGSHEEYAAIKRADYSMTPQLQNLDAGLIDMKAQRQAEDKKFATGFKSRAAGKSDRAAGQTGRASMPPSQGLSLERNNQAHDGTAIMTLTPSQGLPSERDNQVHERDCDHDADAFARIVLGARQPGTRRGCSSAIGGFH